MKKPLNYSKISQKVLRSQKYYFKTQHAVSSALIREEVKMQKPVYYTSRALRGAEGRYPLIEKLAFVDVSLSIYVERQCSVGLGV